MATPGELRLTSYLAFAFGAFTTGVFLLAGEPTLAAWASLVGGSTTAAIRFGAVWIEEHRDYRPAPQFSSAEEPVTLRDVAALEYRLREIEELLEEARARRQGDTDIHGDNEPSEGNGEEREPELERS